jgi:pimeloyl-ACP methyl ester carboxylesterase
VARRLTDRGHPVVTVDLRGHGRSSKPDGPYDVPTVAGDLAALITMLRIDRPVVVGQSWGGNIALELGARYPTSVHGLVCVDGGWIELARAFPSWDTCWAALAPPHLLGLPAVEIEARLRSAHPDWSDSGVRSTLANFELRPDGTIAPWLTRDRHRAILRGLWEHRPSERYRVATVPVLLVPAEAPGEDPDRAADRRRAVAGALAALPNARAQWFTGDHDLHVQQPDALAEVIAGFLASDEAPAPAGGATP